MLINAIIVLGVFWLYSITKSPLTSAVVLAIGFLALKLLSGLPLVPSVLGAAISFILAVILFWFLKRIEGYGILWWFGLITGFCIILIATAQF